GFLKQVSRPWAEPLIRLRKDLGLPSLGRENPLVDAYAPGLHLALFSPHFGERQPDWPSQTVHTGFPFYDRDKTTTLPADLRVFLDEEPAPIVFTLGASSSAAAGSFFAQSARAARRIGRRAVLILKNQRNRPSSLPAGVAAFDYAPFSELFPRAAAVAHHG